MFLSRERNKFKKNDCIDLAFIGCINELKTQNYDATFKQTIKGFLNL